jgi:hypothetical protein
MANPDREDTHMVVEIIYPNDPVEIAQQAVAAEMRRMGPGATLHIRRHKTEVGKSLFTITARDFE